MRKLGLEECKAFAADILYRVDKICRDNNLTYFVLYGTLLGVVRHNGFIPWDDDIDIVMPREDYDTLAKLVKDDKYLRFLRIEETKDTIYPHGKMIDTRTEMFIHGYRHVEEYGIGIDIFPLDYMNDNSMIRSFYIKYAFFLRKLVEHSANTSVSKCDSLPRQMARFIVYALTRVMNTQKLIKRLDSLNKHNKKSHYMGVAWDAALPVDKLFEPVDLQFEYFKVMAPKDYDYLLKVKFGNYMKLPPEEEQIPKHHYDCFVKDEYDEQVKKEIGVLHHENK